MQLYKKQLPNFKLKKQDESFFINLILPNTLSYIKDKSVTKLLLFLSTLILFVACDKKQPLSIENYNKKCLEAKIHGQFLVEYSNGTYEVILASSKKDFFNKILSKENIAFLEKKNLKILDIDLNFKVKTSATTFLPIKKLIADINLGPHMLNAPYLWNQGFYGKGVTIALIDSGYDISHPLLKNSVQERPLKLRTDEDQSGFINNKIGWDFINNKPLTKDLAAHGTIVGSIIAADHTDNFQFSMAPQAKIIPLTALKPFNTTQVLGSSNSVINSIEYAIAKKVDLINASWAGNICSKFIRKKIKKATDKNIIFVTSAGNQNINLNQKPIFPASFPFSLVISVGALNSDFSKQEDSNYGEDVDFFALGSNVIAAMPRAFLTPPPGVSGTSVATPFITGGLALLKSAFPTAPPKALLNALKKSNTVKKIPDLKHAFLQLKAR